jgi:hypothetical protein
MRRSSSSFGLEFFFAEESAMLSPMRPHSYRPVALAGLALLALAGTRSALGDDRDLLRESTGEPYVFIVLDTSGSMHWSPQCTQAQFDAGECANLCPSGECFTRLQSDDPSSKFYQAKEALYEVLKTVDGVQFGFATYNQNDLRLRAKHWLYRARSNGVTLPGGVSGGVTYNDLPFPAAGAEEVFGQLWNCDTGGGDHEIGCSAATPADLVEPDGWEIARIRRLPKGGVAFDEDVTIYVRHAGVRYRVRYRPDSAGPPGAPTLEVEVRVDRCNNASCSSTTFLGEPEITYDLATNALGQAAEFGAWDAAGNDPNRVSTRQDPQITYFAQGPSADGNATDTCGGWDSNTDGNLDPGPDHTRNPRHNLRWPTDTSDARGSWFHVGDVIPLDWRTDHNLDVRRRLAPNTVLDPTAAPDFRTSPYFADFPLAGESFLRLKDDRARPLVAFGSTPLGNSIRDFRVWYTGCDRGSCPRGSGWKHVASAQDASWGCRKKYLLVLTDGDNTCSGPDACSSTASLRAQEGILTYVVAFGVENTAGNRLNCMAANGGTKDPIYPQNKQELVQALTDIFGQIKEQAAAFASAAVPTVQTETADKIYVSNFTPLNGEPIWDGHVDAFLKPLPRTPDGRPDRSKVCPPAGSGPRSRCFLWDAGTELEKQAPARADLEPVAGLTADALKLGMVLRDQRRVFYGGQQSGDAVPRTLGLLAPPAAATSDPLWLDLFGGFGLAAATPAQRDASALRAKEILADVLSVKDSFVQATPPQPVSFVLGDTFHADPVVADRPSDFDRAAANLYTAGLLCENGDPGYRCFTEKHRRRRKMLIVGSNDGQLHVFDAGIYRPGPGGTPGRFDDGTGAELFSYVPRLGMPILRELSEGGRHVFALDSTPRVDDVFVDPEHAGTPDPGERQWRTVIVGGFREGGDPLGGARMADFVSGYYALDVTQPDVLVRRTVEPGPTGVGRQMVWEPASGDLPGCLRLDNTVAANCGPVPFPALLWEFYDGLEGSLLDEDQNGQPDLGQTWSVPTLGRIRVREAGVTVDKHVAIFGGGMDADSKGSPQRGNWLYIVDVETGKAIYKRPLAGAAPADPAVVDANSDGVLDTIYVGTTAGFVYKVDLGTPGDLGTDVVTRDQALPPLAADRTVARVTDPRWDPFPIFDTVGRPIYHAITALFVSRLNTVALAFGTGDREDLWELSAQEGRFYLIVDEAFRASQVGTGELPKSESSYAPILAGALPTGKDFVLTPDPGKNRGWFLRLDRDERVIAPAFGIAGVLIFSSYEPQVTVSGGAGGPVCGRTGTSRVYIVFAKNANGILEDAGGDPIRFEERSVFLAPPTIDFGPTQNQADEQRVETLTAAQRAIMEELKQYCPEGSRFGNYWYEVSAMGSDTSYQGIAAIPICVLQRNWKTH